MKHLKLATAVLASICASSAFAQSHGRVEVSNAVQHDTSPALRDIVVKPEDFKKMRERVEHDLPLPHVPDNQADGALQNFAAHGGQLAPTPGGGAASGILGVGKGFSGPQGNFTVQYAPPDTTGAVGATQYVQVVNTGMAVFNKSTGAVVKGPVPTSALWQGFGGGCETNNDGDATVVYDKAANRWVISQFSVSTTPYLQCVAVSQTSDATGAYNRYAFSYGNTAFPDYPKTGVWPDGYYTTFNIFNGNSFGGAKLCAYDRSAMLAGSAATQQCFQLSTSYGGVLPSDLDGSIAPPAGAPNYMVNFGSNSLNVWKFHVDWSNTANTTLTGPTSLAVAAFAPACGGGTCIPQAGVSQKLDSLADRMMYRLAYRNFADGHQSLVATHSVNPNGSSKSPKSQASALRWYELRINGGTPSVYQQSTFNPDSTFRWMGSIAQDKQGNMALGYSASSGTIHPAVRYTGRLAGDTLNTMQTEASIVEGGGSQTGSNLARWGDYSTMTVDPSDDCTFWYSTEYIQSNGAFNWSTRIGSFKFAGCQ
jgi:hypothetical protein